MSSPSPSVSRGPIRVWLEPGYDYGRFGCWMLDLPGCFTWAPTRERALAQAPSAVGGFVDWLLDHGETAPFPDVTEMPVVEIVAATRANGEEQNALFSADVRDVSVDEVETATRWLGFARDDLLSLADRVDAHEASSGPLAFGDADPIGRAPDARQSHAPQVPFVRGPNEVLLHVGTVEMWLASRLDPSVRYGGPPRDGDLRQYMAATHEWMHGRLSALQQAPVAERTDSRGERWTLAKVIRRLVYHGLDHLDELDRRLAVASGAVDRIAIRREPPELARLARLLAATGFAARIRDPVRLERMLSRSTETYSAWDGKRLVAFARTLTDDAFNAYVSTVAVHPRWQGRGLGRRLMEAVVGGRDGIKFVLDARTGVEGFYRALDFEPSATAMARPRRR